VLQAYRCAIQRADEAVSFPIFGSGHRGFGLEDRVDASHWTSDGVLAILRQKNWVMLASISHLSGNFEENMVLDVPFGRSCAVHV
jgi:hypothetical protein